jgi:hypothetical protein
MDIVVTIPQSEMKNIRQEEEWAKKQTGPIQEFWKVGRRAKKLNHGDRVYFIVNGMIKYYHIFLGYEEDFTCEVTGRFWPGLNLILQHPATRLKNRIPMRGFQGFRYIERIE